MRISLGLIRGLVSKVPWENILKVLGPSAPLSFAGQQFPNSGNQTDEAEDLLG